MIVPTSLLVGGIGVGFILLALSVLLSPDEKDELRDFERYLSQKYLKKNGNRP